MQAILRFKDWSKKTEIPDRCEETRVVELVHPFEDLHDPEVSVYEMTNGPCTNDSHIRIVTLFFTGKYVNNYPVFKDM